MQQIYKLVEADKTQENTYVYLPCLFLAAQTVHISNYDLFCKHFVPTINSYMILQLFMNALFT